MAHHLLEEEVDAGPPFMSLAGGLAEISTTVATGGDGGERDGLDRAGVVGALQVLIRSFGLGAGLGGGLVVLGRLRGGHAGVAAGLGGAFFHEHRHQH